MSEASTADLRARLDQVAYRDVDELAAALRAVLDLCDDKDSGLYVNSVTWVEIADIRAAVAAALGVQRATPPAAARWWRGLRADLPRPDGTHDYRDLGNDGGGCVYIFRKELCGHQPDHPCHLRGERAERGNNTEGDR